MIAQRKETNCVGQSVYSLAIRKKIEIITKDIFLIQKKRLSLRSIWTNLSLQMKMCMAERARKEVLTPSLVLLPRFDYLCQTLMSLVVNFSDDDSNYYSTYSGDNGISC